MAPHLLPTGLETPLVLEEAAVFYSEEVIVPAKTVVYV
jgi:hypothetical protein